MNSDLKIRLKAAYRQLMRPLVRILLRNGIEASEFTDIVKLVYVDVAKDSLEREGREARNKDLAQVTGLTVEEINAVTTRNDGKTGENTNLGRIMKVLSGWHTDPDYTGPYGLPLELTFDDARTPNFSALVERYAPNTEARGLLNELIRLGAVKGTDDNWFKVLTRTYLPKFDDPASLEHLGQSIENFANTIDHNRVASDPEEKLFERVVDNWLSQLDPPSDDSEAAPIHTGLGIYHYVEKQDQ